MSKQGKRKISVELPKTKDLSIRPSVFDRLGTKKSSSAKKTTEHCRQWAQHGSCAYGKSCKFASTHTLISPSKQRAAHKDNDQKRLVKDDGKTRLHSTVIVRSGQSPEGEIDNWDQNDLEYADTDVLEKRRQQLQRELELQMKMDSNKDMRKDKKKVVSSTSSSRSSSSSSVSSSSSDGSTSSSSSGRGEVIYPSLTFSLPCLDFGVVSLGVPKTLELDVINESVVQVRASVKISSDGPEISSITLTDYAVVSKPKPNVPQWPREFNIEPSNIDMGPESRITLRITLTANLIRTNQTSLEIELEKSDSAPIVLPVVFSAVVPEIVPAQDIKLRACFIDFPYQHEIKITSNQFWGYFTVDESKEQSTLEVDVAVKECLIEPNSTICLPVTIKTSVLGEQEFIVRLHLFGLTKPIDICRITGCGVRPIVTCSPMALHWGQVKLLTKSQKVLTLCNDSPVTVTFRASLLNKDSHWSIRPSEGYIDPESETDLFFTLYLIDADLYTNKAVIQLEKVKEILVPLSATGTGTSIVVGELQDHIVLGRHFTRVPFTCKVIMENFGTRLHALEWSEHYKAPKNKQPTVSFFTLEPKAFKMGSGEKTELAVSGTSSKITTVKETWYLIGSIEGVNKKELLLECQITAEFVDPNIEISSPVVELQYDHGPYSEYYKLTDIISIKNVAKLPLDLDITVKPPFAIIQKQNTYKIQPDEENLCCCIRYNENDLNLPSINSEYGPRKSQELIDFLTLKPVEPLRLGPLKFFEDIHKIKKAFTLTHSVEERLEDEEIMKLQILFDTTKHSSLKSKVYSDLMKIKFKGHKNKDAIKLIGTVNFPNLLVLSPKVDFQSILNESVISKTIKIQNVTPLLVCYMLHWKKYVVSNGAEPQPNTFKRSSYASDIKTQSDETESNEGRVTPGMRSGEGGEGSELAEFGSRWPPPYSSAQGYGWTRSATPQHPPAHHLARHSRSQQWLQENRQSYEAEDARARARGGVYYSPPGTSYTIIERPASSHGHHASYSHHYSGKLSRTPYLGSTNIASTAVGATSLRNSTNHLSVSNGKKRPISPEQVLRLFGQGGAAALGKALPPSHPPAPLPAPARRHSPASSPSSTTHHAIYRGGERDRERPYSSGGGAPPPTEPATRTVTMSRDPADSHGFGICVKGGKEAGVGVYISRVEEGSVAERAGLRPGDSILQVNGTPFSGISHEDALKMLKSCRQLTMTVRTAGALVGRASCSWMDRYGRPASPPPLRPPRSASKDRSVRRVDLCIEPGQSLGLMIRGGLEYNLGIYITGVDKDSVADRAGLMVGDQILEVNGQSFVDVTHDEAVAQLKYHKRMSLLVRDVGKVPHACTAYGERDPNPRISGWGKRRGAASVAVEQKARSLIPQSDLPALAYYMEEYAARRLNPDSFLTVLRDLLDTPQKYTLLTEIREFMVPEDRPRFDELVYRKGDESGDYHLKVHYLN